MTLAARLLRAHVLRSTRKTRVLTVVLAAQRQAKIHQIRLRTVLQHDVPGLHIPVDQTVLVSMVQSTRNPDHQLHRLTNRHPRPLQPLRQAASLDVLRHDVRQILRRPADVVHRHDVSVIQLRDDPRLHRAALHVLGCQPPTRMRDLDRHPTLQKLVVSQVHYPKPTRSQFPFDLVTAQPQRRVHLLHRCQRHRLGQRRRF